MSNYQFKQAGYDQAPNKHWREVVFCPSVVVMPSALNRRFDVEVNATGDYGYRARGKTGS
jgi:hypothetical protein